MSSVTPITRSTAVELRQPLEPLTLTLPGLRLRESRADLTRDKGNEVAVGLVEGAMRAQPKHQHSLGRIIRRQTQTREIGAARRQSSLRSASGRHQPTEARMQVTQHEAVRLSGVRPVPAVAR
jgi:hypothetical protein